ncbi:hypothetical protein POM88_046057 [Heracleum sosnowskyi]|uniref:Protein kinase domain-containing protein n=1 Tax=Heracleum sosnowskyi TaxID=360622 RepID=A0AAD8H7P2_9APIA|nr:hypothetical protein POM88_046057 [Heracleum sosnowskyi]
MFPAICMRHACLVAHNNLKATNILLDEDLMPHICNTALAVLKPLTSNKIKIKASEMVIGDTSYIAPEHIQSGIGNMKGDACAFGALLLELLTGRRPFDRAEQSLVNWASSQMHDNESLEQKVSLAIKMTIPSKALSRLLKSSHFAFRSFRSSNSGSFASPTLM